MFILYAVFSKISDYHVHGRVNQIIDVLQSLQKATLLQVYKANLDVYFILHA